ncbi:hypothetical protein B0H13DRAFT_2443085 [Mycena leptocephala]|nr:hypothetical protein B0H13DRAFT_2443085 [Mycena leptocephala]
MTCKPTVSRQTRIISVESCQSLLVTNLAPQIRRIGRSALQAPSHSPEDFAETRVVKEICVKHGGTDFQFAKDDKEKHDIWQDRKNAHYSGPSLAPGAKGWVTDVCVPVSKLP